MTDPDCLFCKIVSKDVPAQLVLDRDDVLAFRDLNHQAPTHVLVVPLQHHPDVGALAAEDPAALTEVVAAAQQIAAAEGHDDFRLVFNTGARAGQSVFHAHGHVLAILIARWCELAPIDGRRFPLATATVSLLGWHREDRVIRALNHRAGDALDPPSRT